MDEGTAERFEAVYRETYRPILGFVLRRCPSADDAADIVAETFATAWRRVAELPEGDEARLWLYGVARRTIANHRRGRQRHLKKTEVLRAELHAVPAIAAGHAEPLSPVAEIFYALPEGDQEVLALTVWEGLDHAEIAKVLGCSRNAVGIRAHRARRRLRRALNAAGLAQSPDPVLNLRKAEGNPSS